MKAELDTVEAIKLTLFREEAEDIVNALAKLTGTQFDEHMVLWNALEALRVTLKAGLKR